jgi:PAS domain S-box-containing protein
MQRSATATPVSNPSATTAALTPALTLRQRAEGQLRQADAYAAPPETDLSAQDMLAVVHELRVHQTELLMQNEHLRQTQTALEAATALYADFYDSAPVGYITLSDQGLILNANFTTTTLLGVARLGLVQQPISRFIAAQDQDAFYLYRKLLLASGVPQSLELRMIRQDGSLVWIKMFSTESRDADAKPVQRIVLGDISARMQVQEQLAESEFRWKFAVEGAGDGLWDWNLADNTVFFSTVWKQMLGYSNDEVGNRVQEWEQRLHPDDQATSMAAIRAYLDGRTSDYVSEHRLRCKDGSYKWVLDRATVVSRSADGSPLRLIGTHSDITARRSLQAALQSSELRYRTLVNDLQVGVTVHGPRAEVVLCNSMALELLGLTHDQLLGKTAFDPQWNIIQENGEPYPNSRQVVLEAIQGRRPVCNVVMGVTNASNASKTNPRNWLLVNAIPQLHPDATVQQVICTFIDIGPRKLAEAKLKEARMVAESANLAKSRFLAAASHDLRQPLAALSLFVGLLKNRTAPSDLGLVTNIQDCVDSLSELLTDLLDISKLDAGVVAVRLTDFSLDDFFNTLESVHAIDAQHKGLALRLRRCGRVARTDHQLLTRIVGNFVTNAIRYTVKGGVLIACRKHADKLWIEVWDTGMGIPKDKVEVVFEEFSQLGDGARTQGSGLGLAIASKMARLMGLQIRLHSRPGRGSMFAIELPQGKLTPSDPPVLRNPTTQRRLHIGLIDDNVRVLQALTLVLESAGHSVVAASNLHRLLGQLGHDAPDILVSDYRLPDGQTGFDAIEAARARYGATLPAIIITGDTDPALIRSMSSQGLGVLYKPLQADALLAAIDSALERRVL